MTHKQALIGQPYAQRVNDVLQGLEWECPLCKGRDYLSSRIEVMRRVKTTRTKCPGCTKGKLHYSWTPQVGEWCINKEGSYPQLISDISEQFSDLYLSSKSGHIWLNSAFFVPILHWEEIERVLEKAGYSLIGLDREKDRQFHCDIMRDNDLIVATIANSRIKSVYEAVIELGKENKR